MIYRGPGFLAVELIGSSPSPFPPPLRSVRWTGHTHEDGGKESITDERGGEGEGVGEEPNHMMARNPGPLWIIQYSLDVMLGIQLCSLRVWDLLYMNKSP